jgi:hypothetical protein
MKVGDFNSLHTLNNGQRSLLLIGVDSIETSKPELKSLWLVTYLPSDPTINFFPILPSGTAILSDREDQILRSFALLRIFDLNNKNFKLVPGQKFSQVLEENNYWWSGYFIYDQAGIMGILDLLNLKPAEEENSMRHQILETPDAVTDSEKDFSSQLVILQSVCHVLGELTQNQEISQVATKISSHMASNLELQQIISEWETLFSNESAPNCRFPTLQVSRVGY